MDAGATTEAVRQLQNTIMATVRANAGILEEQSGVTSSLTDSEIREQIEVVTNELKKYRQPLALFLGTRNSEFFRFFHSTL